MTQPWWRTCGQLLAGARETGTRWTPVLACVGIGVVLTVLALAVSGLDRIWLSWIAGNHTPGLTRTVARGLSRWGELHMGPLVALALLWQAGRIRRRVEWLIAAAAGLLAMLTAGAAAALLKCLLGRPRPLLAVADVLHGPSWQFGYQSFPSGHATHCWALVASVAMLAPRWAASFAVGATSICWARLYLERHYPSDVLAGVCLGSAVGAVFGWAARRFLAAAREEARA